MANIYPYLTFNGDCEAAFTLYAKAFGKKIEQWSRYADMPRHDGEVEYTEAEQQRILHVVLPISDNTKLFGSDSLENPTGTTVGGSTVALSVDVDSRAEANQIFSILAEGGSVSLPLEETFWGAYFGMLTDRFGVQWMVNYDDPARIQAH